MRRRLLIVLAIAVWLWAPRDAAAECELIGPFLGTGPQLPVGCPLYVYAAIEPFDRDERVVTVLRGGAYVDVTGSRTSENLLLTVERTFFDCRLGTTSSRKTQDPYNLLGFQPAGVSAGERVGYGRGWIGGVEIVAAGPCAAPIVPMPTCALAGQPPCAGSGPDNFEPRGCSARGGGGLVIGVMLLGLRRRARGRRRH